MNEIVVKVIYVNGYLMIRSFFIFYLIASISYGQATLQQSLPQELFTEGVDMMSKSEFGSARQYFERYLSTSDKAYEERASYNIAICALSLYHLDGEPLMNQFIANYPTSQLALMAHFEMGNYFFQDKDYKNAIIHFEAVNSSVLDGAQKQELAYKLGYSYFSQKNFEEAIGYFNSLKVKNGKYKVISAYYAGYIEFGQEKFNDAIADLKIASTDPNFSNSVPSMLASVYYKKGDYQELINYLTPLITNNSSLDKNQELSILLAESYYFTNQYSLANQNYAKALTRLNKEALYNYGVSLSKLEKRKEAINVLKQVAGNSDVTEVAASYLLGNLYLKENEKLYALGAFTQIQHVDNNQVAEESHFLVAKIAYQLNRTSQSIENIRSFIEKYPNSSHQPEVSHLFANALLKSNDYVAAIDYIESLPLKNSELKRAYQKATYLLGVEQYNSRNFRLAVSNFKKSIENSQVENDRIRAHLYIAEALSLGKRYNEAEAYYNEVLSSSFDRNSYEMLLARYGMGYCLYNQKKYEEAKLQFAAYLSSTSENDSKYGRAVVRLADCEYVEKNYTKALSYYKKAIEGIISEKDYAYYQMGVIQHLLNLYEEALINLDKVINIYPSSPYWDDALYEKGSIYLEKGTYDKAIVVYSKLIADAPQSKYVPFALEKRALSNFNRKLYARTVADYELFLKKYPYHPSINNVLLGLQQAYTLDGRSTDFNATLNRFKEENPDVKGLEVVEFDAIKGYFNEGLYLKAEEGMRGYIASYPSDFNLPEAKFILAESYYRQQKNKEALKMYYQMDADNTFDMMYRIYERIADLEYNLLNYSKANKYYHLLIKSAISNNQQYRSYEGIMKSHYFSSAFDSVFVYADKLLKADGARNEFLVSAYLFKGKAFYAKGNYDNAIVQFEKTIAIAHDENGAEAQYLIGEIKHSQKQYEDSNEALYLVPQKYPNHVEWLDKSFLLIVDNFIGSKEYFQAKATLQSIIEYTSSDITKSKAKNRLEWLIKEEQALKSKNDTLRIVVKDTIPDE